MVVKAPVMSGIFWWLLLTPATDGLAPDEVVPPWYNAQWVISPHAVVWHSGKTIAEVFAEVVVFDAVAAAPIITFPRLV